MKIHLLAYGECHLRAEIKRIQSDFSFTQYEKYQRLIFSFNFASAQCVRALRKTSAQTDSECPTLNFDQTVSGTKR